MGHARGTTGGHLGGGRAAPSDTPGERSRWLAARRKGQSAGGTLGVAPLQNSAFHHLALPAHQNMISFVFSREPV